MTVLAAACGGPSTTEKIEPTTKAPAIAKPPPAKSNDHPPEGDIVTKEVLAMNGPDYGRPPTDFRKGSVAAIATPKAKKTDRGFEVQFPSHATITTPTVYDGKVIVSGGFQGTQLFAYESKTGKPVWGIDLHDDGPSSPACERGTCVISTESCTVFAIDAETGKQRWSYWLGDPLTSAPTIAGDLAFVSYPASATGDGKPLPPGANHVLAAFELESGKLKWQLWLDGDVMSSPVAVGEFVYVSTFAGTVIKIEQPTGKIRYAMRAKATSAPVVQFGADGVESMYYTRRGEHEADGAEESIIRADHNEPKTKYETAKHKAAYIDPKVQGDSSYAKSSASQDAHNGFSGGAPASAAADVAANQVGVGSVSSIQGFQGSRIVHLRDRNVNTMGNEVIATDVDSGKELWTIKLDGDEKSGGALGTAPLAAGSHAILYGTLGGEIVSVDPSNGKRRDAYKIGGPVRSQPVVDGGWIYVGTEDGRLVAIDTKDPLVTGWPTWGGNAQRTGVATFE
ncbi:MAG TPA: PQQ-binding-like beta-propeller repeat protein [Kofleriaceae bacterium]|nr:PQQ-binding-like beta-propeller repeat protein [Kofleriaceae bacterium]